MVTFVERFGNVFDKYDDLLAGEVPCDAAAKLYRELRPPGIRLAQVQAGLETLYGEGMGDVLEKQDFEEGLLELDRRYFLLQDLMWEFKVLARPDGLVTEDDAKLLFKATHEQSFSASKYERWLKSRIIRGSGVSFAEIDVLLCNKPTSDEIIAELPSLPKEHTQVDLIQRSATTMITDRTRSHDKKKKLEKLGYLKKLQDLKAKRSENLKQRKSIDNKFKKSEDLKKLEEHERKRQEEEDERKRIGEEKKRAEERAKLEELQKAAAEKQILKDLQDQEDSGKLKDAQEETERKAKEEAELEKQRDEEEKRRKEEEDGLRAEKEADEKRKQKEADSEAAAAAALQADILAQEQRALEADKTKQNLLTSQMEEEMAQRDLMAAEEALEAAKAADDHSKIAEAQRLKKEADERARTSKMIKRLTQAIQSRDVNELETTISDAKKKKINGVETYVAEAEELVNLLYAGMQLENACRDRSIEDIETAIQKINDAGYEKVLAKEMNEAELLLKKLKRLEFLKRQVMELKQQTIAELKSYSKPPPVVKFVMTATFLILGHDAKEIKQWNQMVVLMGKTGKEGLKRRIQSFEPDNISWDVAEACQEILVGMDTGSVADVSAGAAAFYIWCDGMVEERLSLPIVIPKELKDFRRASIKREESNKNLTKGRTVDVLSRRSRSRDRIEAPVSKPAGRSKSSGKSPAAGTSQSKSPAAQRSAAQRNAAQSKSPATRKRR